MSDQNSVNLIGNLGTTPDLRYTNTKGTPVCNFSLATNEVGRETPEWHRIVVWGKTAETCAKYLSKGRKVHIDGRLQTRRWQHADGSVRYCTEVHARRVNFLDRPQPVEQSTDLGVGEYSVPEVDELSEEARATLGVGDDSAF